MNKTRVLIVDDSAVTRKLLSDALSKTRDIEVVGTAMDPYIAVDKIKRLQPDILTLDIEMPRMDGLTFLSRLMVSHPMPVIMVSALTDSGADSTIKALQAGAVDFILKPNLEDQNAWEKFSEEIVEKVRVARDSKIKRRLSTGKETRSELEVVEKYSADVIIPKKAPQVSRLKTGSIVAMGASTGGTEVLARILGSLSAEVPGIVIVQHMPEKFTKAFADRVDRASRLYVKEAEHGDRLYKGVALIAPGNRHMLLRNDTNGFWVEINDGPPVNRHKPAVDVIFRSVAQTAGPNAVGILLTGMGADGAAGLLEMKEAGAATIAQDEASSTVFGMPREAIRIGAADHVKNIESIIGFIEQLKHA